MDGCQNTIVQMAIRRHNSLVRRQLAASREIKRTARHIGHSPAGFFGDQGPRGMVPDLFAVVAQAVPQVERGFSAGNDDILRLAVEAVGWALNSDALDDL